MKRVSVDVSVTELIYQLALADIVLKLGGPEGYKKPFSILRFISGLSASG